jgi:serine/threonine protein kinase
VSSTVVSSPTIRVLALMERVECETLSQLLADFPRGLPEPAVRRFAVRLVDDVCYVHDCGLSHRDIKLDNVLLSSDCTIHFINFGCAMRGANGLTCNGSSSIAGTLAYMPPPPPESLTCLGKTLMDWTLQGKAQDVWAIGCVVHHYLTAERPWSTAKQLNPYVLLLHFQSFEFSVKTSALSPDAVDFCLQCVERGPWRRTTAAEVTKHPFLTRTPRYGKHSGSC